MAEGLGPHTNICGVCQKALQHGEEARLKWVAPFVNEPGYFVAVHASYPCWIKSDDDKKL